MAIATKVLKTWTWYPFNEGNLAIVPDISGVYCLGVNDSILSDFCENIGTLAERQKDKTRHWQENP